jgi:hypothetical protein
MKNASFFLQGLTRVGGGKADGRELELKVGGALRAAGNKLGSQRGRVLTGGSGKKSQKCGQKGDISEKLTGEEEGRPI